MNENIRRLGFWSSIVSVSIFVAYTICFMVNYFYNSSFKWTNSNDFVIYSNSHIQIFKYVAMVLMIIFSFSFLIQLECLRETVYSEKRFFVRVARSLCHCILCSY
jgi:hypothetical protein